MYTVLLYYKYIDVPNPVAERAAHLSFGHAHELTGRILIGAEGINGTVAGIPTAIAKYIDYMNAHALFTGITYKSDIVDEIPFEKLKVKVRDEIVTLGEPVDLTSTASRLSPEQFNAMLASRDVVLFDARNNYESAIGRFKGAITPDIDLFKDLPAALDHYDDLKDKTVITYCTGGIRCEKASALMKQRGFTSVYQLDGGIINYAKQFPDGAFEGKCFVFDARMSVGFTPSPALLGSCITCEKPTNDYYNCAYSPCNKLILVCSDCILPRQVCSHNCAQLLSVAA